MANWQQISDFNCIVENSGDTKNCVVLFHGYGADAGDLNPLSQYLDPEGKCNWIFPEGPLETIIAPGMKGRAWFEIDTKSLEEAMRAGSYRKLSSSRPDGLDNLTEMGLEFLKSLQAQYDNVIIGGFSQGSMLATEILLQANKKPDGLIVLSGTLLDKENTCRKAKDLSGIPLFQSHGHTDALLDPKEAVNLFQVLKEGGMEGKLYQFKGGHEIPVPILIELKKFIDVHSV